MRFQDYVIESTERICDEFIKNVRAIPADKLEWVPMADARSALDLAQEVAQSPIWFTGILQERKFPDFNPEDFGKFMEMRKQWTTVNECERVMKENLKALFAVVKDYPDADFDIRVTLPFGEDTVRSLADLAHGQYWNANYHLGQICYIQLMLGDKEFH